MDRGGRNDNRASFLRSLSQASARWQAEVLQRPVQSLAPSKANQPQTSKRGHGNKDRDPLDMRALCVVCGVDMGKRRSDKKFCSRRCKKADENRLEREAKHEALAGRCCERCGEPIPVETRKDAKYCGSKCHPRLYAERRTCGACGKLFRPKNRDQVHCSISCAINSKRAAEPRPCQICGTLIPNPIPRQMYCSDVCKARAYRLRKRGG